jgi:hypothetical protein
VRSDTRHGFNTASSLVKAHFSYPDATYAICQFRQSSNRGPLVDLQGLFANTTEIYMAQKLLQSKWSG